MASFFVLSVVSMHFALKSFLLNDSYKREPSTYFVSIVSWRSGFSLALSRCCVNLYDYVCGPTKRRSWASTFAVIDE